MMIIPFFTVQTLEREIFEHEGVRVVLRAPRDRKIPGLSYKSEYCNRIDKGDVGRLISRVSSILTHSSDITFDIIDGNGKIVTKTGTRLIVIRRSYTTSLSDPSREKQRLKKLKADMSKQKTLFKPGILFATRAPDIT